MFVHSRKLTIVVSSGAGSGTMQFAHEHLKQIVITPPSSTDEYDFTLTNPDGTVLYDEEDNIGSLNETTDLWLKDTFTLRILNASADGNYVVTAISYEPHK